MKRITPFFITLLLILSFELCKAQSWQPLTTGLGGQLSFTYPYTFTTYNSKLVVAGRFTSAGGNSVENIALWDGNNWSTLGSVGFSTTSIPCSYAEIKALAVYNNSLIVGGSFKTSGTNSINCLAAFNGTTWTNMLNDVTSNGLFCPTVEALLVHNGSLYAAGNFKSINGFTANCIVKWNGSTWSPLGNGLSKYGPAFDAGEVKALTVYNNDIIAAGIFTLAGNTAVSNIAKWDGTTWTGLGSGIPLGTGQEGAVSLCTYSSGLYVGNSTSGISKWDGTSWGTVGGGLLPSGTAIAKSMTVHNNKLIVGGLFNSAGPTTAYNIASWDGSTWGYLGGVTNNNGFNGQVYAVGSFNSEVYSGGLFSAANGPTVTTLQNIARFNSSLSNSLRENEIDRHISIYPNPIKNMFNISGLSQNDLIEIFDVYGQRLKSFLTESLTEQIDLSTFSQGLYFIKITDNSGKTYTRKILKQ